MGAVAQYERTNDVRRMLTSAQLAEAIIREVKREFAKQEPETNIRGLLPARAATSMRYDKAAKTAVAWNEDGKEEKIDLPLEDGWRVSDGNPFGVPNGQPSTHDDSEALYLVRHQDRSFSGPVGLGDWGVGGRRRGFVAYDGWSGGSGVALVDQVALQLGRPKSPCDFDRGRDANVASDIAPLVRGVEQAGAAAPLVEVPKEALAKVADPQKLREDAAQLRQTAENLQERFKGWDQALAEVVKPMLEKAARFIEVAEAIEQARKV